MKIINALLFGVVVWSGCSPAVNPGATLWAGLNNYHEQMGALEARPERWPDRQRLAEAIKTTYIATLGASREFNRLVDLDLKRRELSITLRNGGLKAERAKEIREELVQINEQIDGLTKLVARQLTDTQITGQDRSKIIETVATVGLLSLAIEAFSSAKSGQTAPPTTQVGPYMVIDQGVFAAVRSPEGQTFRCTTSVVPDEGASIRCEPVGGKS